MTLNITQSDIVKPRIALELYMIEMLEPKPMESGTPTPIYRWLMGIEPISL